VTSARRKRSQFLRVRTRIEYVAVALTEALRNVEAPASNLLHHGFSPPPRRAVHDSSIGAIYERTA
jgi:hypothetical protein